MELGGIEEETELKKLTKKKMDKNGSGLVFREKTKKLLLLKYIDKKKRESFSFGLDQRLSFSLS